MWVEHERITRRKFTYFCLHDLARGPRPRPSPKLPSPSMSLTFTATVAMKYTDVISLKETVEYIRGVPNNRFAPARRGQGFRRVRLRPRPVIAQDQSLRHGYKIYAIRSTVRSRMLRRDQSQELCFLRLAMPVCESPPHLSVYSRPFCPKIYGAFLNVLALKLIR